MIEFALVAPVLALMMIGLFDLSHNMYSNSMLHGAIQKAARDSTIEGVETSAIDETVKAAVLSIAPGADVTFKRTAYANFSDVSRPEDFDDLNKDGACNDGEPFEDANSNGRWDEDKGSSGQGGARDATLYEVSVEYTRIFPLTNFIGISDKHATTITTVLRNQPYAGSVIQAAAGNCD